MGNLNIWETVGSFDVHEKKSDIFINTVNVCNDKTTVEFAKKKMNDNLQCVIREPRLIRIRVNEQLID
jgi:hypothetical protein